MGNSNSSHNKIAVTTEKCLEARKKIRESRQKILDKVQEECKHCPNDIELEEEVDCPMSVRMQDTASISDSTCYRFPFENIVFEGGGAKGIAYCGVGRALEEHGILNQIHRFAGTSIGAITATMFAVGYNSFDVEKMTGVNMEELVNDAYWGYFSLLPNLLKHFGWNPGNKVLNYLGAVLSVRTGNPDITFAEVYKKYGNELCIVVTNVNTMSEEYCHVKTTPDMPIRKAVRMSMSIPGLFQVVRHKLFGDTNLYVDGGVICNYPIHCFDGWWLSLDHQNSFIHKIQPITNAATLMDRRQRFNEDDESIKTLGCLVYSDEEIEYFKNEIEKKSGVPRGDLPNTELARKWAKTQRGRGKLSIKYTKITEATTEFIQVLRKNNLDKNAVISREEFKKAFTEEKFSAEYSSILFGDDCDVNLAFEAVDRDGNGNITYSELINFVEELGVCIHERYLGIRRTEVGGFFSFLSTIFLALGTNVMRIFMKHSDVKRTIGIKTWYITTTDFGMADADKNFLVDQGKRSTMKFLQNFVLDHKLEKLSQDTVKSRKVPNKLSLTEEELAKILN